MDTHSRIQELANNLEIENSHKSHKNFRIYSTSMAENNQPDNDPLTTLQGTTLYLQLIKIHTPEQSIT